MLTLRRIGLTLGLVGAIGAPAFLSSSALTPASAQVNISVSIGFDDFHEQLAPYGRWINHPRWGEVWHPTRVSSGFKPYYEGHWEDTEEYGWMWVSDESWGDIPYHYGRWVFDRADGWLWVPGYVWGPSWVVWREGGGNIGWFPMPPDDDYYGEGAYRDRFDDAYGYRDWYGPNFSNDQFLSLWVFVGQDHFRDRNYRQYAVPPRDVTRFISQTRDTTRYTTVNKYVVNRSIDDTRLQRDTKQQFKPVPARNVMGRNARVTPVDVGRQVEQRERQRRPIPAKTNAPDPRAPVAPRADAPQPKDNRPDVNRPGANRPDANRPAENDRNRGSNDRGNDRRAAAPQPAPPAERPAPAANPPRERPNTPPPAAERPDRRPAEAAPTPPANTPARPDRERRPAQPEPARAAPETKRPPAAEPAARARENPPAAAREAPANPRSAEPRGNERNNAAAPGQPRGRDANRAEKPGEKAQGKSGDKKDDDKKDEKKKPD
ncbi:MAG: DUF6600 domain-containing protein [Rhodospirillaceae bacterium]